MALTACAVAPAALSLWLWLFAFGPSMPAILLLWGGVLLLAGLAGSSVARAFERGGIDVYCPELGKRSKT